MSACHIHPEKRRFGTQAAAEQNMYAFWRKGRRQRLVCRVYECACGGWHMTKKARINPERGEQ